MESVSIKEFYKDILGDSCPLLDSFLQDQNNTDIGHFNVFNIAEMYKTCKQKPTMPYNRRTYYKISLIQGKNRAEYADRAIEIEDFAILFASPKIPYHYLPLDSNQGGHFCIFTPDFLPKAKTGFSLDDLPIFNPSSEFIFRISQEQFVDLERLFNKMHEEMASDYAFKYDLLRTYVIELIHQGQKLKPLNALESPHNAASRITTLFIELLERQFPIESPTQTLTLRTANDYADVLRVHVNHLNKVLKDLTGKTTTEIIRARIVQEAKVLLKQTNWNISEIAYSLGFQEVAHFSNFFKKNAQLSPLAYRK